MRVPFPGEADGKAPWDTTDLRGQLDVATHDRVTGWAWEEATPDAHVEIAVYVGGVVVARTSAGAFRADLLQAGIGRGDHAFDVSYPRRLGGDVDVEVAVTDANGTHLGGSPTVLLSPATFALGGREAIARIVAGAIDDADVEARISFLEEQAHALRRSRAEGLFGRSGTDRARRLAVQDPDVLVGGEPAEAAYAGARSPKRPLALVIDERRPDPTRDAGSNALLSHVRSLERLGYDVAFAASSRERAVPIRDHPDVTVLGPPFHANVEDALAAHPRTFDVVYMHRISGAAYAALARRHQPGARLLYSVADLHWLRLARQAEVEGRPELRALAARVRREEEAAAHLCDAVITHSRVEAALIAKAVGAKVHVVHWDVEAVAAPRAWSSRSGVVFVGGLTHAPNLDAAMTLALEVMPAVRAIVPRAACRIYGDGANGDVMARLASGVQPMGRVPSLRAVFARARVSVAPLAYGACIKGKVLDSFAQGVPCVMSAVAAESLELPSDLKDLVANDDESFARTVAKLLTDREANEAFALSGLSYVRERLSPPRVDEGLARALGMR